MNPSAFPHISSVVIDRNTPSGVHRVLFNRAPDRRGQETVP